MTKPKRMGRPPIAGKLKRKTSIRARVTEQERAAVQAQAGLVGKTETDFVRDAVFSAVPKLSGR